MNAMVWAQNAAALFLTWIMSILLKIQISQDFALEKLNAWRDANEYLGVRYDTSWNMQKAVASVTNGRICGYCEWNIASGERHGYCEAVLNVEAMPDDDLITVWNALDYDPNAMYDAEAGITMEQWEKTVYSEVTKRCLDWWEDVMVTYPHCYAQYWSEDGHPSGTLCPICETE